MERRVRVGLVGSQFISTIHAEALRQCAAAEILAVASPTKSHVAAFAEKFGIPHSFTDYREMLALAELDLVVIGAPNDLHCPITLDAAAAGKHVVCEKPLCLNLAEADAMIEACRNAGVKLMYAEELCFAPKYERVRQLVKEGAISDIYMLKQSEKHSGPHTDWFYDVNLSGGGVLMDMGCHAMGWFRWMLNNAKVSSVYASMTTVLHKERTKGEDNSVVIIEFENGVTAVAENSWAKHGGMDDKSEVYGTGGVVYADLFMGNAAIAYSKNGYGYAMEKADTTVGWSFMVFEEIFNQGYPHELKHFIDCVQHDHQPVVTGEDGRAVLEIIYAAYASAAQGKKITLPFTPKVKKPVDLWL